MTNGSIFQTSMSVSVPILLDIWRSRMTARGATPHPLSFKEYGQFKSLMDRLGQQSIKVVAWAVDNWLDFSHLAILCAGLPSCPTEPHIGFLLTHANVALNEMFRLGLLPGPEPSPTPEVSTISASQEDPAKSSIATTDIADFWISKSTDAKHPYARTLTRKEIEQFSKQRSQLGDARFDSVMRLVLSNWYDFTQHVRFEAGETNLPLYPYAVFLLNHMTLAMGYLEKREAERQAAAVRAAEHEAFYAEELKRALQFDLEVRQAKERQKAEAYKPTQEDIDSFIAEYY